MQCDRWVTMANKRGNGEGSIYKRSQDGLWVGVLWVEDEFGGRPRRRYITGKQRSDVVRKFKTVQRQVDDGLKVHDPSITVEQLFARWYEDVLKHQVATSTASNYMTIAKYHIIPSLGKKKIADLTTSEIDRLLSRKMNSDLSVSTVQRIRSVLAQALDQAMRWGWVNRNVAKLARPPRMERSEGRSLTPEQARHFLNSLSGHRNEALYALMLSTGLRRGEALGLKWTDLDEEKGLLHVRRQLKREDGVLVVADTKTSRSRRTLNLPGAMLPALQAHRERQNAKREALGPAWVESGFIFTTDIGTPFEPRNMHREFKLICLDAGLGDWHPHELRHSAASLMLAHGVKLQVVSELLGHSSIRMTADVYGHILDPDRQAAADIMNSTLWSSEETISDLDDASGSQ
jgi:integrase